MTMRPCGFWARRERITLQKIGQLLPTRCEYIVVGRDTIVSRRRVDGCSRVPARRRSARYGFHYAIYDLGDSVSEVGLF